MLANAANHMIDASDQRLVPWLAALRPRHELVIRMALNGGSKNQGPNREKRVDELRRLSEVDTTATMAKQPTDARRLGRVIEAWAAGDG